MIPAYGSFVESPEVSSGVGVLTVTVRCLPAHGPLPLCLALPLSLPVLYHSHRTSTVCPPQEGSRRRLQGRRGPDPSRSFSDCNWDSRGGDSYSQPWDLGGRAGRDAGDGSVGVDHPKDGDLLTVAGLVKTRG